MLLCFIVSAGLTLLVKRHRPRRFSHYSSAGRSAELAGTAAGAFEPVPVGQAMILELVGAAARGGAALPEAFAAVGKVVAGERGRELQAVAGRLTLGAQWSAAWQGAASKFWLPLREATEVGWRSGAPVDLSLQTAAQQVRKDAIYQARTGAAKLGTWLVFPLGLCFLPAFFLIGLLPVLISIAQPLMDAT